MRSWSSSLAIALLSITLVQAGVAACCWTPEAANAGTRDNCHPAPRSSHSACAPADAVKGVSAQFTTSHDRLLEAGLVSVAPKLTSPVPVVATAIDRRDAAPSFPDDLFLRIHVLLI